MKLRRSLYARPEIIRGEQCAGALPTVVPELGKAWDGRSLRCAARVLQVVCGSGCRLEAGVDVRGDQLDLLGGEGLAGCLEGRAEGVGGKDWDAVD